MVMGIWAAHLAYPLHYLQTFRFTVSNYAVPIYYPFVIGPLIASAAAVLMARPRWTVWTWAWWLLPLACLPGIVRAHDPIWAIRQWASWAIRGIVPGVVVFLCHDDQLLKMLFFRLIFPVAVAAAVFGLIEFHYDANPFESHATIQVPETNQSGNPFYRPAHQTFALSTSLRPQGTQGNRIPYAALMTAFLPIGFYLSRHGRGSGLVYRISTIILMAILIVSQARSAWLGTSAMVLAALAMGFLRGRQEGTAAVACVAVCGLFLAAWPRAHHFIVERAHSFHLQGSIHERLDALRSIAILKDRWLVGVGFGQFPAAAAHRFSVREPWSETPDDQYLRWSIENGLFGALSLAAFLVSVVVLGWRSIGRFSDVASADYYKALLIGWLGISVTFVFFDGYYWGACAMTYWCLLGMFARSFASVEGRRNGI